MGMEQACCLCVGEAAKKVLKLDLSSLKTHLCLQCCWPALSCRMLQSCILCCQLKDGPVQHRMPCLACCCLLCWVLPSPTCCKGGVVHPKLWGLGLCVLHPLPPLPLCAASVLAVLPMDCP